MVGRADLLALTIGRTAHRSRLLVILDGTGGMVGWGEFGQASGWLAPILPTWLFLIEELRAQRTRRLHNTTPPRPERPWATPEQVAAITTRLSPAP